MRRIKMVFILSIIWISLWKTEGIAGVYFKDVTNGINDVNLNAIAIDPNNSDVAYVGSSKSLYKTANGGKDWIDIIDTGAVINFIAVNPLNSSEVYVATANGLYKTHDGGKEWKNIFSEAGEGESNILCIAIDKSNSIYIGSHGGIFISNNGGENWDELPGRLSNLAVRFIAINPLTPDIIYAATNQGLFKSVNKGSGWERVFVTQEQEEVDVTTFEDLDELETDELKQTSGEISSILINPVYPDTIYLASLDGIYITQDGGSSWREMNHIGLQGLKVKFIISSPKEPDALHIATNKGIFEYPQTQSRWQQLYKGLTSTDVRMICWDNTGDHLWLATSNGVFKSYTSKDTGNYNFNKGDKNILSYFEDEPTIKELQDVAIRYAEVHPDKISVWRKQARLKAVMPDLSFSADTNLTDFRHWDSGTNPDSLLKGERDIDYAVTLSWDLGDLVWSTDQTSIDVRSRLMVQLRDDILDEVTRLYFERRRLQVELITSPPEDIKTYIEKELRLQELTADIDGLTGGYLSKHLSMLELQNQNRKSQD